MAVNRKVSGADTFFAARAGTVTAMVTDKRFQPNQRVPNRRRPFYLKEWRKFMGAKAVELAIALDVERESYYRLEREPWRLSLPQIEILADSLGIKPPQFWFPPPAPGETRLSVDDLIDELPDQDRQMVVRAVRGMVCK